MASKHKTVVVQGGVTSSNGNQQAVGQGFKVGTTPMPLRPAVKPWQPNWHPKHPQNQS